MWEELFGLTKSVMKKQKTPFKQTDFWGENKICELTSQRKLLFPSDVIKLGNILGNVLGNVDQQILAFLMPKDRLSSRHSSIYIYTYTVDA